MTPVIRVLLVEDNRIEARQTQHWLESARDGAFAVEVVDRLQAGTDRLAEGGIDIVLLDLNLPDSRGLQTFTQLYAEFPEIPVVVLTGEYDLTIGPSAVEQGAQDYLIKQQADAISLIRVLRFSLVRHNAQMERMSRSNRSRSAKVFGFTGAKGGVGTSMLALNVATALAARRHAVILVELQPGFGDLTHQLKQEPISNLSNLLELPANRIDEASLERVLSRGPADLRVLFSPQLGNVFREIESAQVDAILRGLTRLADFVIIDLPHVPTAAVQTASKHCHFLVTVTEREPASLICAKGALRRLHDWGIPAHQTAAVVVNRTIYPLSLEMSRIHKEVGCDLIGFLPSDATACLQARTTGTPLILSDPNHDISLSLMEIVDRISADKVVPLSF